MKVKIAEIRYAGLIAEHNLAMNLMEHLPNLIKVSHPDSDIAKHVKCKRTKVTAIIKNVIGAECTQNIMEILRETHFSLIIDESTDKTQVKHLCLLARFSINCELSYMHKHNKKNK